MVTAFSFQEKKLYAGSREIALRTIFTELPYFFDSLFWN
jgi:hypothetical protein